MIFGRNLGSKVNIKDFPKTDYITEEYCKLYIKMDVYR